jgi:proton-dependent oligopeptide transporter, POT family
MSHRAMLTTLSAAQTCKFFSHYGVQTLLVMYMISTLHFSEASAFAINACFCGVFEFTCLFGGIVANRHLGLSRSLIVGGMILCTGYLLIIMEEGFFASLGCIVVGNGLFSPAMTALAGSAYEPDDSRREKGFTVLYIMQSVGAFFSTILGGCLAAQYGFSTAFAVSSIGMVVGTTMLLYRRCHLTVRPIHNEPHKTQETGDLKSRVWIALGVLTLFYAASEQSLSSLIVFAERATNRTVLGYSLPSSLITVMNPLIIVLCGSAVARYRCGLSLPLIITAFSFGLLSFASNFMGDIPIGAVAGAVGAISVAELMVGPIVTSFMSEVSTKKSPGTSIGLLYVANGLSSWLGGELRGSACL